MADTTVNVVLADATLLREVATDFEHWGPPASDNSIRAGRLRALADALEKITREDVEMLRLDAEFFEAEALWHNRTGGDGAQSAESSRLVAQGHRDFAAKLAALLSPADRLPDGVDNA